MPAVRIAQGEFYSKFSRFLFFSFCFVQQWGDICYQLGTFGIHKILKDVKWSWYATSKFSSHFSVSRVFVSTTFNIATWCCWLHFFFFGFPELLHFFFICTRRQMNCYFRFILSVSRISVNCYPVISVLR